MFNDISFSEKLLLCFIGMNSALLLVDLWTVTKAVVAIMSIMLSCSIAVYIYCRCLLLCDGS